MAITLPTASVTAAADNIGQVTLDATTFAVASAGNITLVLTTDLGAEITRIQALADATAQAILGNAWTKEQRTAAIGNLGAGKFAAYVNSLIYANILNNGLYDACDALDFACTQTAAANAGLAAFLAANNLVVDQYTADMFNAFCAASASGAYARRNSTVTSPTKIPATSVFNHVNVDTLNIYTATGTATGTLGAGSQALSAISGGNTIPGGGTLEAYAGGTIGAASYTITVTYVSLAGVAAQTVTFTIPSGTTANTVFTPGATVQASQITSVAVTTGVSTTGDIIKFRLKPVRVITA